MPRLVRERNPNWKGGRTVSTGGYVQIRMDGHPLADARGYVYEHRLVAEQMLGRPLRDGEVVHHINGNPADNRPENLEVAQNNAVHRAGHRTVTNNRRPGEPNPIVECECGCGLWFERYDAYGRPRRRGLRCGRRGIHRFDTEATVQCACGCGTVIKRFDYKGREHRFVTGHNFKR